MASLLLGNGITSLIYRGYVTDSVTGALKTGLSHSTSGLIVSTIADNEATPTAYTQAGSTIEAVTTLGTYSAPTATKCRFKEVDATNHPGYYEFQFADARLAVSSAKELTVQVSGGNAHMLAKIQLHQVPADVIRWDGSSTPVTNVTLVYSTDFSTVYDTTNKAFLSKLGDFAHGGSSMTLTFQKMVGASSGNDSCISLTGSGTGIGLLVYGGNTATSAVCFQAAAGNGHGLHLLGAGTGDGLLCVGGGTAGNGARFSAGAGIGASGMYIQNNGVDATYGLRIRSTNDHAMYVEMGGVASGKSAVKFESVAGDALNLVSAGGSYYGLRSDTVRVTGATTFSGAVAFSSTTTFSGAITATNASNNLRLGTFTVDINAIAWNSSWDAEVQSEAADALTAYGAATAAQINSLAVNTRANISVPVEIETPDAGSETVKIRLFLFDIEGNMEAPDSTPTIALVNAAGTDRSSRLSAASNPSTGVYSWDYTNTASDAEEQLIWTFTVVEGGLTRSYPATSYVVEETAYRFSSSDRATLNATATAVELAKVPKSDSNVTWNATAAAQIQSEANDALVAYDAATGTDVTNSQTAVIAQVDANETKIDTVTTSLTTLAAKFVGITLLADWLRRMSRKDVGTAGMATAESEIQTGGTATFVGTTDNLESIRDVSGGSGAGSATVENQELILDQLQAALTAASAVVPESAGTIEGFPDTLTIGDSYVTALNNFIKVYVRDSSATPLTGIGTKNFSDADFEAVLTVSQGSRTSLVTATCTWVPAAGPVEGYVKVEFTTDQTRRATEGSATMQLVFKWDGGIETTIATQPVEWEQRVTRSLR